MEDKIIQIADHYGFTSQANMLTEEAAEFTVALNKLRRGNTDYYDQIKEEVADVLVIAYQLRHLLGAETIDKIIEEKVERQLGRIREEEETKNECFGANGGQ
jgi:NTP pyrophosphatase (non-canonical NTP hydrolase)